MKKFLIYWFPAIIWMSVIFLLSTRQRLQVSTSYGVNFLVFKFLHLCEYAFLYILNWRAVKNTVPGKQKVNLYFFAFLLTVFYASTDELHQQFIATREGTLRDVIIDSIGAGFIWYVLIKLLPKARGKLRNLAKLLELT